MSYSLLDYTSMMRDSCRVKAYADALQQVVTSDSVVLDLGAGTGIFSLLACSYGAKKVYAVETNEAIAVAKELAAENGFSERLECLNSPISDVDLDEKVDIIVSDLRGVLPLYDQHIPTIVHAREKHLKAGGSLLPCSDTLWLALANTSDTTEPSLEDLYDTLDLSSLQKRLKNVWRRRSIGSAELLSEPKQWSKLDYASISSPHVSETITLELTKSGEVDGFFLWFDAEILPSLGYSGGPRDEVSSYGCVYFPFLETLSLNSGFEVQIALQARLIGSEYTWTWDTSTRTAGTEAFTRVFSQSSFYGDTFTKEGLQRSLASDS